MPIQIDVRESRELQAALLALASVPREIRANVRRYTRAMAEPEWQAGLERRAMSTLDRKVLVQTARVQARDTNVDLRVGAVGKLKQLTKPVEFGANRDALVTYQSRRGKSTFKVTRHTRRQLPWHRAGGRVVYPTAADLIPRFASRWVQTIVRTFHEALEKR